MVFVMKFVNMMQPKRRQTRRRVVLIQNKMLKNTQHSNKMMSRRLKSTLPYSKKRLPILC